MDEPKEQIIGTWVSDPNDERRRKKGRLTLTFTKDDHLSVTLTTGRETFHLEYKYRIEKNKIIASSVMNPLPDAPGRFYFTLEGNLVYYMDRKPTTFIRVS